MDSSNMLWLGACQGGKPRSCLWTLGEGSCLLCRFEAKALVKKEQEREQRKVWVIYSVNSSAIQWERVDINLLSGRLEKCTHWGQKKNGDF